MSIQFSAKPLAFAVALIATGGLLSACGGGSTNGPRIQVSPANAYLLTSQNRIIGVDLDDTQFARSVVSLLINTVEYDPANTDNGYSVNALDKNEKVLDIDYRNSEGLLYALTRLVSEERVVIIDPTTGLIYRRGTITTTTPTPTLSDVNFTIDFDPAADELRVIGSDNTNYSIVITSNVAATAKDAPPPTAVATKNSDMSCDSKPSCSTPLVGAAYTDEGTATPENRIARLFGIDTNNTYALNDAATGKVSTVRSLGISGATRVNGFDIDPITQRGIAIITANGSATVYTIDSTLNGTGNAATSATTLPTLPNAETYTGLSLVTPANPTITTPD